MRTVCITGAANGIGKALAQELAPRGDALVLVDRDEERLAALARTLPGATALRCDLACADDLQRVVATLAALPALDVLVHAAGISSAGTIAATPSEEWQHVFGIDCFAVASLTRGLLPALARAPRGRIVVLGSVFGFLPAPRKAVYAAAKAALHSFARSLAAELHGSSLRVVTVVPGAVATDLARSARTPDRDAVEREHAFLHRRGASPARVARAIAVGLDRDRTRIRVGLLPRLAELAVRFAPGVVGWAVGRWRDRVPG